MVGHNVTLKSSSPVNGKTTPAMRSPTLSRVPTGTGALSAWIASRTKSPNTGNMLAAPHLPSETAASVPKLSMGGISDAESQFRGTFQDACEASGWGGIEISDNESSVRLEGASASASAIDGSESLSSAPQVDLDVTASEWESVNVGNIAAATNRGFNASLTFFGEHYPPHPPHDSATDSIENKTDRSPFGPSGDETP